LGFPCLNNEEVEELAPWFTILEELQASKRIE